MTTRPASSTSRRAGPGRSTRTPGAELIRFGIPDETLRLTGGRLLRSLRPRKSTGGQAHVSRPERRVLQGFAAWPLPGDAEATLIARATDDGRVNPAGMYQRARGVLIPMLTSRRGRRPG
jgi:hypothetical protein